MKRKNKWPNHCWFSPPIYKLYVFVSLPDLPHLQTFEPNHCRQSFLKPGNPLYMASYSTSTRPQDNNLRYENGSTFKINWSITRAPKNLQNWYWYAKCDVQRVKSDLLLAMDDIRCLQVYLIWLLVAFVWEILIFWPWTVRGKLTWFAAIQLQSKADIIFETHRHQRDSICFYWEDHAI